MNSTLSTSIAWSLWLRRAFYQLRRGRLWLACAICLGLLPAASPIQAQSTNIDAEIVYLDAQGYIRVLDPVHPNNPAVQWISPVGGWQDFALGDFNGDGDAEIVAVRNAAGIGQITIYDPVITDGAIVPNQLINGIPWRILYDSTMTSLPFLVQAGDLDPATPGDEIAYLARRSTSDDDEEIDLALLHATASNGFTWAQFAEQRGFNDTRTQMTLGELVGGAAEEIVLVGDEGILEVYEVKGSTLTRILNRESNSQPWQAATIARFFSFGPPGLVAARASSPGPRAFGFLSMGRTMKAIFAMPITNFSCPPQSNFLLATLMAMATKKFSFCAACPARSTISRG